MVESVSDLKPCPFCGTQPEYTTEGQTAWIKCPQCHQSKICSNWYDGDLGLMEACWNKRQDNLAGIEDVEGFLDMSKHLIECYRTLLLRGDAFPTMEVCMKQVDDTLVLFPKKEEEDE